VAHRARWRNGWATDPLRQAVVHRGDIELAFQHAEAPFDIPLKMPQGKSVLTGAGRIDKNRTAESRVLGHAQIVEDQADIACELSHFLCYTAYAF
jgi:hypothetical protein